MAASPDWSSAQLWIEVGKVVLPIAGFVVVFFQLRFVARTLKSNSASKLYDQYLKLNELFLGKPALRPYFYDNKPVPQQETEELKTQVASMAEAIMGILEHAALQRRNLPSKSWQQCWKTFTKDRLQTSPSMRQFYVDNEVMYAKDLRSLITKFGLSLPQKSRVQPVAPVADDVPA